MGFLKDFYSSKDTIKREKSDQKIFLIHICNKELIQRISKELVQIHKKTKGKLSEKGQKAIKTPPQGDGGSSGSQVTRKTGRQPQQGLGAGHTGAERERKASWGRRGRRAAWLPAGNKNPTPKEMDDPQAHKSPERRATATARPGCRAHGG